MLGHASIQQTQRYLNVTDEELQERTGGELEQQRPTASPGVGKLIDLVWLRPDCPRFVPGNLKFWLRGRDLNPRPLGYEPNELPDCSTPRQEESNLTTPLGFDQPNLDEKLSASSPLDRS